MVDLYICHPMVYIYVSPNGLSPCGPFIGYPPMCQMKYLFSVIVDMRS